MTASAALNPVPDDAGDLLATPGRAGGRAEPRPDAPVIAELRGAVRRFGDVLALDAIDLQVHAGEVLAVLGCNGAGKTTSLGLLTGRLRPDAGQCRLFGQDPSDPVARRHIGVMLQEASLPGTLQVGELVRLFSSYYGDPRPPAETLQVAGLESLSRRRYGALSGGQQRRVQFALAICGRPRLLFVDEPTVGLDVEARRNFWRVLRQLAAEGVAVVLTTHYLEEADALADRIVLMADGRVRAQGSPEQVKARALGKRVVASTGLALAQVMAWPQVDVARIREGAAAPRPGHQLLEVRTGDAESLLRRWLEADPELGSLEVGALSLEDAFLSLTATETRP